MNDPGPDSLGEDAKRMVAEAKRRELRCVECERPVVMERGLNDPPQVICIDCEAKIDNAFWDALYQDDRVPATCKHCGKEYEDFSDLGCGHCDRRHPEYGMLP
jgi:hypothetical protein